MHTPRGARQCVYMMCDSEHLFDVVYWTEARQKLNFSSEFLSWSLLNYI